jgi:hypothetical protein
MKRVFIARGVSEAYLVRAYLENAGVGAIVRGEELSTVFGGIPIDGDSLPSVWVIEDTDYDRAMELIRETSPLAEADALGQAGATDASDWQCPHCGESVEGQFGVCWNCGAEREVQS